MTRRRLAVVSALVAFPLLAASGAAQSPRGARTSWGDPDLQGLWTNATLTPLQRPAELAAKPFYTP
jgi:hypothetical protein